MKEGKKKEGEEGLTEQEEGENEEETKKGKREQ